MGLVVPPRARYIRTILGRAAAHLLAPALARHARHRHRRHDAVLLLLPRARADPRPLRAVLRRAADAQLHAPRRPAARPAGRAGSTRCRAFVDDLPGEGGRVRGAADRQPHLEEAHGRHRRARRPRWRSTTASPARCCAAAASRGTCARRMPYEAYGEVEFDVPMGKNGDTYDRYLVRMEEMRQANRILAQCLDKLPEGPIMAKRPRVLKAGKEAEVYHGIEGPKGEIGFYIVGDGTPEPLPLPRAAAVVRQPAVAAGADQGAPGGRSRGADRHDRHRARGGGSLMPVLARSARVRGRRRSSTTPSRRRSRSWSCCSWASCRSSPTWCSPSARSWASSRRGSGPNRVGPWGLLQPIADVIKLLVKEDTMPRAGGEVGVRPRPLPGGGAGASSSSR